MAFTDRLANRVSISTGYDIDNSIRLEPNNNEWLYNASPTAGNRRTYTISFWIKRAGLGTVNAAGNQYIMGAGQHGRMFFGSDDFQYRFDDGHVCRNITRKFRDPSAWYHFVVAVDTTHASPSSDRVKLYVNGETLAVDDHDDGSYPDQNDEGAFFSTNYLTIGTGAFGGSYNAGDGDYDIRAYLAEFCAIDGQQLTPSSFGETDGDSGIWKPKDVSGLTFGDEGYYLKFDNSSSLGADSSGNSNDFTLSNITAIDQTTDTPTNNFCTLNPNDATVNATYAPTISEGALKYEASGSGASTIRGTMGMSSGKWYWEVKVATNANGSVGVGTANAVVPVTSTQEGGHMWSSPTGDTHSFNIYSTSHFYSRMSRAGTGNSTQVAFASGTMSAGDIMSVAYDADNQDIYLAKNGSWTDVVSGQDPTQGGGTDTAYTYHSYFNNDEDNIWLPTFSEPYNQDMQVNFGNPSFSISSGNADANGYGNFEYAPPSGYYALCTKNLAEFG